MRDNVIPFNKHAATPRWYIELSRQLLDLYCEGIEGPSVRSTAESALTLLHINYDIEAEFYIFLKDQVQDNTHSVLPQFLKRLVTHVLEPFHQLMMDPMGAIYTRQPEVYRPHYAAIRDYLLKCADIFETNPDGRLLPLDVSQHAYSATVLRPPVQTLAS